jgi:hypothetical protein
MSIGIAHAVDHRRAPRAGDQPQLGGIAVVCVCLSIHLASLMMVKVSIDRV